MLLISVLSELRIAGIPLFFSFRFLLLLMTRFIMCALITVGGNVAAPVEFC
jgi:hypothetical protein